MADYDENCTHDCGSCGSDCPSRGEPVDLKKNMHDGCSVKKVIGVVSGKGGVGKSMVTALSAIVANRNGLKTGILDADITGPSIPKMFGVHEKAEATGMGLFPVETRSEIELMSLNLLTENETDPVVWRGPVIAGAVTQFWTDVIWGDLDVMFIDMPPGTGDVPLTIFQSIPVDGIIIVTSPQELVSMIVEKAMNMAKLMNIPILGLVENMSYLTCPDCGRKIEVFGPSTVDEIAKKYDLKVIEKLPIDPKLAALSDAGRIEFNDSTGMESIMDVLADIGLEF